MLTKEFIKKGLYCPPVATSSYYNGKFHPIYYSYLHIPVQLLHELLLLLLGDINFLHVVSEVHVLEGRELLDLRKKTKL